MKRTLKRMGSWSILVGVWFVAVGMVQHTLGEEKSGIELAGRTKDDRPLESWSVYDASTDKLVVKVERRWGFMPLPPGTYRVDILPAGFNAVKVTWGKVDVAEGKASSIEIKSGVELSGRSEKEPPLEYWYVRDAKSKELVAKVNERWGFTPLPPGNYEVSLLPQGFNAVETAFTEVEVAEGKTTSVEIKSGVEVTGRTDDEPPLDYWYVREAKSAKAVAKVHLRWGFTPLPPGSYEISLLPQGFNAVEIAFTEVEVAEGKTTSVEIKSGVEVTGRSDDEPPLEYWYVRDAKTKKDVAKVHERWGFTPLPPGDYELALLSQGFGELEIPFSALKIEEGKAASVAINSGVELTGKSPDEMAPEWWYVHDAKTKKQVAKVNQRWGFVPLPPGDYRVVKPPLRFPAATVKAGEIVKLTEPSLEERLSRATGEGLKREKELDPAGYQKLEEEIERAIRRGADWLKTQSVLKPEDLNNVYPTIGILALVHAGELDRDPELGKRCLDYLLRRRLNGSYGTYATSLTAMALRDIDPYRYRSRIFECAQWLVENQGWGDEEKKVWGYGRAVTGIGEEKPATTAKQEALKDSSKFRGNKQLLLEVKRQGLVSVSDASWDNSNAQFAVLGLHSSANAGIGIPRESWQRVADHFVKIQCSDGGWAYHSSSSGHGSMTCAGLASLVTARYHLGEKVPALDHAVVSGLEWLEWQFTVEENPHLNRDHFYYLYGLERVGILAGTEFFGEREWYTAGARYLLEKQRGDGSWLAEKTHESTGDRDDYLDTCYAILFLRRATLPLEPVKPAFLAVTAEKEKLPAALLPSVEVILDSSGSMKEMVGDQPKIKIAQAVMADVLDELPDTIQLGLRLYGHRNGNEAKPPARALDAAAKTNTQLVLPIAPLTQARREKIKEWVNWAAPWGWTPMIYSVLQAKNDFPANSSASKTVVLISDGAETCGGKLEDIGKAYRDSGIDIVIHVVGFDVEKDPAAKKQLMEIATLGGGKYFNASDAAGLSDALDQALQGIEFIVIDPSTGNEVSRGGINDEPVALKPGKYLVHVSGLKTDPLPIELTADQMLELNLDQEGKLAAAEPEKQ